MKTFTLNGNVYSAKEIGFNLICELEEQGISLEDIERKPMSMLRSYIAFCVGGDREDAGTLIEEHIINGGSLADVAEIMGDAMRDSGFFQALGKGTEKKTSATKSKAKKEKVVAITEA